MKKRKCDNGVTKWRKISFMADIVKEEKGVVGDFGHQRASR